MTSETIARLNAALEGRYRIDREIGEGGMATVYLADDIRHQRQVALKVLKPELAAVVGAERFLTEIRTTANLQHPNILPLFDSGEADGFLYYVMPFVDGETLRARLDREKQLPVDEAVRIATEVADALQAAHEQGIIHRDIKPANILLSRGRPLVADFGIALAVSGAGGGRLTETGLSLGTPFYMSPEQASADREPSPASDVYSLASVLYEMLVGEPPYTGATAQAVLARILTADAPAATEARPSIPPHVDAVLRRGLERLPADRFARAGDFARSLADRGFRHGDAAAAAPAGSAGPRTALLAVTAVVALVATAVAAWALTRPTAGAPQVARFPSPFLPGQEPVIGIGAIAPDGSFFVYAGPSTTGEHARQLWVRRFDELESRPLEGTGNAMGAAISPDGTQIAYRGEDFGWRAIAAVGGPSRPLIDDPMQRRVVWGDDGFVYGWSLDEWVRTREEGGALASLSGGEGPTGRADAEQLLPGGRGLLVTTFQGGSGTIAILDIGAGALREVGPGQGARFIEPGYLVFRTDDGFLSAGPFDLSTGAFTGPVVPILDNVADFDVSDSGTLLYRTDQSPGYEFVWLDREGRGTPAAPGWMAPPGLTPRGFDLSPDGRRIAFSADGPDGSPDVWIRELPDGALTRLTDDPGQEWNPRWLPGGERVTYTSGVTGGRLTLSRRADGAGGVDTIFDGSRDAPSAELSPDGEWLVLRVGREGGRLRYIAAARPGAEAEPPEVILGEDYNAFTPALSPDGRHLAYVSDESGRWDVYARPFPDVEASRLQVSNEGGSGPVWSPSGDELFYVDEQLRLNSVRIETSPRLRIVEREVLFAMPDETFGLRNMVGIHVEVSSDGERFLVARRAAGEETAAAPGLVVVLNWIEELKRLLED
jgi:serine/threonine-protein kinase